jgi:hypothetical protein
MRAGRYLSVPRQQVEVVPNMISVADEGEEECGLIRRGTLKGLLYCPASLVHGRVEKQAALLG